MSFLRLLSVPLLAAALLLTAENLYFAPVVTAQKAPTAQKRSAHSQKQIRFRYICPMHEDVKSKTPGKCPKCKMKLEKKRIKEPTESPGQ